ncbi:unnamed protein product [Dibothriocephalus latus]|uniref:Uncharacterized protein n=1 Tax=Dibothriocephalus latus TaxID=60516 RepID=A0A3P7NEE2_DIBLA|nr:unnamed protein product [Dibothriocephalus latus]
MPCPPCYNLIQKRVHELRDKLANLFGGDGPDASGDQSELNERVAALNKTVQHMYKEALDNSGGKRQRTHFICVYLDTLETGSSTFETIAATQE